MNSTRATNSTQASGELARLVTEFGEQVDDATIRLVFEESLAPFRTARIRLFVPILSYRHARESLRARVRSGGSSSEA